MLLLSYPNEYVDHVIQELLRELSDQTMLVNLHQINQISGGLSLDSLFLNQAKPGRNLGCKCNHPANRSVQDRH